jgi:hypothetical protein
MNTFVVPQFAVAEATGDPRFTGGRLVAANCWSGPPDTESPRRELSWEIHTNARVSGRNSG